MARFRGPLADSYGGAVALVVSSLIPYLMLSAAMIPLAPTVSSSLGVSKSALDLAISISTAGYAVGTVLAVQFAVHRPQRRMLVIYEVLFTLASVLAAAAPNGAVFMAAFIVQGLCTSLMLIASVPPLVTGWPSGKMPITGFVMNLCVFGAVAIGPTIGGYQAAAHAWRPLFWVVAAIALSALCLSIATFEEQPPADPDAPIDLVALLLAAGGCVLAFYGAAELENGSLGAGSLAPLLVGFAMVVALVVHQYRTENPLMPVSQLATTLPAFGILIAMCVSAGAFGLMELALYILSKTMTPERAALLFWPEFAAALVTAVAFGWLFRSRYTPMLALFGTLSMIAASAILFDLSSAGPATIALGAGLIGLGVGSAVSPAMFIAGFSLRAAQIQRVFAFIELIRGVSAFLFAPVLLFIATDTGTLRSGLSTAVAICLGLSVLGAVGGGAIFFLGGSGLQTPDLERWQRGETAWRSPRLFERARRFVAMRSPVLRRRAP